MRILVVENDALTAMSIQGILEDAGHDVVCCANDLGSAREMVAEGPRFDLALIDFHLDHGCSGVDVPKFIIPMGTAVLFVSSNPDGCRAAMGTGALGCLQKPFTDRSLVSTVTLVETIVTGEAPATLPHGLELYSRRASD